MHPEQGPVWQWVYEHDRDVFERFGENYCKVGVGAMRKIDDKSMEEIRSIFDVSGGTEFFDKIEKYSDEKAREMGYDGADDRYFQDVYTYNSGNHQ